MIVGFIADPKVDNQMGTGKTLFMTIRAKQHYDKGERIIANYGLRFPHEKADSAILMELVKNETNLNRCVLALTEMHVLLDSRTSLSKKNRVMSYLILQTRKRQVYLFYDSQDMGQVDIRLRNNTNYYVFCRKIADNLFYYRVVSRRGRLIGKYLIDGRKYYHLYDTAETVIDFAA